MTLASLRALVEVLNGGVIVLDDEGLVLALNAQAGRAVFREPATLVGKDLFTELSFLPGGAEARETFREGLRGSSGNVRLRIGTASMPEGSERREVAARVVPVEDERTTRAFVVLEEDTGGPAREALAVSSRVKHDVNNLLMGLIGNVVLLQESQDLNEAARRKVDLIEQQGRRIRDRIADLDVIRTIAGGTDGLPRRAD